MTNQEKLNILLTFITPGIIQMLANARSITPEAAAIILYNSRLYRLLEDEKTKLWHLGYPLLYDMLEEELTTGEITFPEEQ